MEVIFKPTHACNGNCVYCAASEFHGDSSVFPLDHLHDVFQRFRDWLDGNPGAPVRFVWHGGEPLLCGPSYYEEVTDLQRQIFGPELYRVKNTFQSNITLINESWIPVLKRLVREQPIGSSFDIVPGIRGLRNSADLADKWLRAFELLRKNDIRVGVVYTVHKKSLDRAADIYWYFRNLDPAMSLRLNPMYNQGSARNLDVDPLHVTPQEYGQFLLEVLRVWMGDGMAMTVAPLQEWQRAWLGDQRALCCDSRGECHHSHLGVNPDGAVFGCGRMSDEGLAPLGNILHDAIDTLVNHESRRRLAQRSQRLIETECAGCPYWSICHGGCPLIAWLYYHDELRATYLCPARKMVYGQMEKIFRSVPAGAPGKETQTA